MVFGFGSTVRAGTALPSTRNLTADDWAALEIPLLVNPREVVKDLCARHLPAPGTAVVAVYGSEERPVASASFARPPGGTDGWERRNAVLEHLRRVIPHDLRRRSPVRTAVLMVCREGPAGWTAADGAWMWGLHDACTLHGLRCGAYVTLTATGWRVLGDERSGRTPHSRSWSERSGSDGVSAPGYPGPQAVPRRHVAR